MSWISGACYEGSRGFNEPQDPHLVTVAELLQAQMPLCVAPGPAWSKCCREADHLLPHAALGTDGTGTPIVVTWYEPGTEGWLPALRDGEPGA